MTHSVSLSDSLSNALSAHGKRELMEQLLSHASAIAELAKQLDIASVELLPAQAKEVYTLLDTANKAIQDTVDIAKKHGYSV